MKQNLFYLLLFINGLAIGWLLVSTLASLGSTKQNVLDAMQSVGPTKQSSLVSRYRVLNNCKSAQITMHKDLGPIYLQEGVY